MLDKYNNFQELKLSEVEGIDYNITFIRNYTDTVILAPHGGDIEPGTSELSRAIAGNEYSLYLFEGIKLKNNNKLHLMSTHFDEPIANEMVACSRNTLAIHGLSRNTECVYIGGRDEKLIDEIAREISKANFHVKVNTGSKSYGGTSVKNICNKNHNGKGVQLELTRGFRKLLFKDLTRNGRRYPSELFNAFIKSLRTALSSIN